jgi:DNA repair protein RadC
MQLASGDEIMDKSYSLSNAKKARAVRNNRLPPLAALNEQPADPSQFPVLMNEPSARLKQASCDDDLRDREMLFALLSHMMPMAEAGRATGNLLGQFGSFADTVSAPTIDLAKIAGLTPQVVFLIKAIEQAADRLSRSTLKDVPLLNNWPVLQKYLNATLSRQKNEIAKSLFLNKKNRLISDEIVSAGDVGFVQISPRKILMRALELNSSAVIIAHNHPAGDPSPSEQDLLFTRDFGIAASYLDIVIHDHIIVAKGRFFSFRREGLLN